MRLELQIHPKYDGGKVKDFFEIRNWTVEEVAASNIELVIPAAGSAIECGDGRFGDLLFPRKKHGPKVFGGVNGVALLKTGGDTIALYQAAAILNSMGFTAGTHGAEHQGDGCGLFALWRKSELLSAKYVLTLLEQLNRMGIDPTVWVKKTMARLGGNHFTLPGVHQEQTLLINPFVDTTSIPSTDRFSVDFGFMMNLGITASRAMLFNAETVEKLSPVRKLALITR